jgi:hypothetical protein
MIVSATDWSTFELRPTSRSRFYGVQLTAANIVAPQNLQSSVERKPAEHTEASEASMYGLSRGLHVADSGDLFSWP